MILNSPTISGSLTVTGNIIASGSITLSGSVASASYAATASFVALAQSASYVLTAQTASFVALAQSASNAVSSATASFANTFTVASTLTAQTLVVQTITSSVDFVTGSTRFGSSLSTSTHQFTGSVSVTGSSTFTAGVTPLTVKGTNAGTMYTEYYYNTSTLVGSIGNGSGLLSGANASDFIIRSEADYVVATGGNNRRMTISSAETTFNFNPQSGSLLSGYNYLNFGGGSIMYRNMTDLYIGSNAKYGSAGTTVACYTSANGMGMLTMDGGALNYQSATGSVTANTAYGMPIRFAITAAGNVGIGVSAPRNIFEIQKVTNNTSTGSASNASLLLSQGGNINELSQILFGYTLNTSPAVVGYITTDAAAYTKGALIFATRDVTTDTAPTERMRITSGGSLLINSTSVVGSDSRLNVDGPNAGPTFSNSTTGQQTLLCWNKANTGDNLWIEFHVGSTLATRGSIDYNRSTNNTRYNTSSDANLKNIIGDSNKQKSIDILNSTKIKEFSWKEDESNKTQIGVIAQELYETYKGAVSVGSDESLLGTEDYKSWKVDKTAFTFHLIAGWQKHEQLIQELKTQNDALQSRIETLESK